MQNKKIAVLSIDGGGIRGILAGMIIKYLEDKFIEADGENARIADYFNLQLGTDDPDYWKFPRAIYKQMKSIMGKK